MSVSMQDVRHALDELGKLAIVSAEVVRNAIRES
jgi:hypothetical protein